jgi:hypothetical protein
MKFVTFRKCPHCYEFVQTICGSQHLRAACCVRGWDMSVTIKTAGFGRLPDKSNDWSALLPKLHPLSLRLGIMIVGLLVIFLRTPSTFTNPQFWAEDGVVFFGGTYIDGWRSLMAPAAGYLCTWQRLVALAAIPFGPSLAPAIYNYFAVLFALIAVWMVTSPRLDMPLRPLLALAIVVVPRGFEILGTTTNIQWIAPIGAFATLFMRPSRSLLVSAGEAAYLAVTSVTGPFSIFFAPLFMIRAITERRDAPAYRRLVLLNVITFTGAFIQLWELWANREHAFGPSNVLYQTYDWRLWLTIPVARMSGTITWPPPTSLTGDTVFSVSLLFVLLACISSTREPYRLQKIFMLYLGSAIAVSGMMKLRSELPLLAMSDRYFYVGNVFALWWVCCLAKTVMWQSVGAIFVAGVELAAVFITADTPRIVADLEWPARARFVGSGLPVVIPQHPPGWYVSLPAEPAGPLARFITWTGRRLHDVAPAVDSCRGEFVEASTITPVVPKLIGWVAKGWVDRRDVEVIALVDSNDKVFAFGFPGLAPDGVGWSALGLAHVRDIIEAYAIIDGRACRLGTRRWLGPEKAVTLPAGPFIGWLPLTSGKRIVQRFASPSLPLRSITMPMVTNQRQPSAYSINWRITSVSGNTRRELANGMMQASNLTDWQTVGLAVPATEDSADEIELELWVSPGEKTDTPAGVPFFSLSEAGAKAVEAEGSPTNAGLKLEAHYIDAQQ